jgi:hypothetical protein
MVHGTAIASPTSSVNAIFLHHLDVLGAHISPSLCLYVCTYVKMLLFTLFMVFLYSDLLDQKLEGTIRFLTILTVR